MENSVHNLHTVHTAEAGNPILLKDVSIQFYDEKSEGWRTWANVPNQENDIKRAALQVRNIYGGHIRVRAMRLILFVVEDREI